MLVFLIGMMGAGKTTLGWQLANKLGYSFVDLDDFIEKREGKSIAQIFEQEGQERFRELERAALEAVVTENTKAVISTGGGTPCFFNNMDFMNGQGKTIFFNVPLSEIFTRLSGSNLALRPLLANKTEEERRLFLTNTLAARKPYYEQAVYTLNGPDFTVQALLKLLNYN